MIEGNPFDAMRASVDQARDVLRAADAVANNMAILLRGRLRNVSLNHLAALKRELRDFNMNTKQWKERT